MLSTIRGPFVVSALAIACALSVVGWKLGEWNRRPPILEPLPFDTTAMEKPQAIDSDRDGLPDWQEELIGTDTTVANQGAEELLATFQKLRAASSTVDITTLTGSVGIRIAQEIETLKQNGNYTAEKGLALADKLLDEMTADATFTPYPESAFAPTTAPTQENIQSYVAAMKIALTPLNEVTDPDFVLFATYIDTGNTASLQTMRQRASTYAAMAHSLMLIRAPRDIATDHQRLANALLYFQTVTSHMVLRADDPLATLALIRAYNEAERYLGEQLWIVDRYLSEHQ